jgi:hypothetical protein
LTYFLSHLLSFSHISSHISSHILSSILSLLLTLFSSSSHLSFQSLPFLKPDLLFSFPLQIYTSAPAP